MACLTVVPPVGDWRADRLPQRAGAVAIVRSEFRRRKWSIRWVAGYYAIDDVDMKTVWRASR